MILKSLVFTNACENAVVRFQISFLKVRIHSPTDKGTVSIFLIKFLSEFLSIPNPKILILLAKKLKIDNLIEFPKTVSSIDTNSCED